MKYLLVLLIILTGCVPTQQAVIIDPIIRTSNTSDLPETKVLLPGHSLPKDLFVLKILNGLSYRVVLEITSNDQPFNFLPGSVVSIPFKKDRNSRVVVIIGQVFEIGSSELVGTISNGLCIPNKRDSRIQEGIWHITSFTRLE